MRPRRGGGKHHHRPLQAPHVNDIPPIAQFERRPRPPAVWSVSAAHAHRLRAGERRPPPPAVWWGQSWLTAAKSSSVSTGGVNGVSLPRRAARSTEAAKDFGLVTSNRERSSGANRHHLLSCSRVEISSSNRPRIGFAGTPPTIVYGGTSRVTTAWAATTAPSPMEMPCPKVTSAPTHTSLPMVI